MPIMGFKRAMRAIYRSRAGWHRIAGCARHKPRVIAAGVLGPRRADPSYLIKNFSLVSLVPFISSRIQRGVRPLPVHFRLLSFLD